MWGTRLETLRTTKGLRFIPTHVGNTLDDGQYFDVQTVHPHACGEHAGLWFVYVADYGSSPRMWGTLMRGFRSMSYLRFIPTHVGNTKAGRTCKRHASVHPHACGEHVGHISSTSRVIGSSPRMWGTPCLPGPFLLCQRFIPTHVGNTSTATRSSRTNGSSPRMWGTLKFTVSLGLNSRFIPTHVGNTLLLTC